MALQANVVALLHRLAEPAALADDAVALDVEVRGTRAVAGLALVAGKRCPAVCRLAVRIHPHTFNMGRVALLAGLHAHHFALGHAGTGIDVRVSRLHRGILGTTGARQRSQGCQKQDGSNQTMQAGSLPCDVVSVAAAGPGNFLYEPYAFFITARR